jgi:hypothetical protein
MAARRSTFCVEIGSMPVLGLIRLAADYASGWLVEKSLDLRLLEQAIEMCVCSRLQEIDRCSRI